MEKLAYNRIEKYKPFILNNAFMNSSNNKSNEENITEIKNTNNVMTTQEKILAMSETIAEKPLRKIKKDKGLIERTESSVTILTEDNKELLKD